MIALIAAGIFILSIVVILVLMLRAPRGREIPYVGFVRDDDERADEVFAEHVKRMRGRLPR